MQKQQYLYQLELKGLCRDMSVPTRMKISDTLLRIFNYLEREMTLISEKVYGRFKEERYTTMEGHEVCIIMVDPEYRHRAFIEQSCRHKTVTYDTLFEINGELNVAIGFCDLYDDIKDDCQTIYVLYEGKSWAVHLDYPIKLKDYLEEEDIKWTKLFKCLIQKFHEEI
jgi:hypothetical protein